MILSPTNSTSEAPLTAVPRRSPDQVMTLARLGSFHQTRLSFLRSLLRRAARENWRYERRLWQVDAKGEGVAVYRVQTAKRIYSLICFSHDLPPEKRSDRVIADEWDATFVLYDGDIDPEEILRLQENAPHQEAGRYGPRDLVLSRANRSVRLFDYVVTCLAAGDQPDTAPLAEIGYLMRTTAVYGNGKFGLADRCSLADRPELAGPFQAEMLTVWLIRSFTIDIVEHMARQRAPETAVPLAADLRRVLGVGNATGLGMAPFLVLHSALIDRWIDARETALARVRSLPAVRGDARERFLDYLARAQNLASDWPVEDELQRDRILGLRADLRDLKKAVEAFDWNKPAPWDRLIRWSDAHLGLEAQEMLVTLVLEPHGDLIDDLADEMSVDENAEFTLNGTISIAQLQHLIETHYDFALKEDYQKAEAQARFWYVSEEKLEPRLGERFEETGGELEQPLGIARDVKALYDIISAVPADQSLAAFLQDQPELRHIARRVQITARHPYAEIRGNLLAADMRPIDLLRCKLAFFGATRFDPKSDRWLRITLFQHAPFPDEIDIASADDWALPPVNAWPERT